MKGNNALLARQKAAQISAERLAISCQFGIRSVAANVVDKILSNLRLGSKSQTSRMRKMELRINESFVVSSIPPHKIFKVLVTLVWDIVTTDFGLSGPPVGMDCEGHHIGL